MKKTFRPLSLSLSLRPPNVHIHALELEVGVADVGACGVERVLEVARG